MNEANDFAIAVVYDASMGFDSSFQVDRCTEK